MPFKTANQASRTHRARACSPAIALSLALIGFAGHAAMAFAAPSAAKVTAAITKQYEAIEENGLSVVELVTIVSPPNMLTPVGLKTPAGVVLASSGQNASGCAPNAAECRQRFSLNLDTRRSGCSLTGDYVLELQVSCRPGAAAAQCQPGSASVPFKLTGSTAPNPTGGERACAQYVVDQPNQPADAPKAWRQLPGTATDVGMGGGSLWAVGTNMVPGGFGVYRWDGKGWVNMNAGAVHLDVDAQGYAWAVNDKGEIHRYAGNGWSRLPGIAKDIGVGANGAAWVIGAKAVAGGFEIFRWNDNSWQLVPGGGVRIDVDPQGNAWVVSEGGDVFRYTASGWAAAPGVKARDIGIGADGSIFVAAQDGSVHKWNGQGWIKRDGRLSEITVDARGAPFGVSDNKQVWMGYP